MQKVHKILLFFKKISFSDLIRFFFKNPSQYLFFLEIFKFRKRLFPIFNKLKFTLLL